jgi:hypothetical protein
MSFVPIADIAWWQSPLSSSSNASAPDLRLIVENHVRDAPRAHSLALGELSHLSIVDSE